MQAPGRIDEAALRTAAREQGLDEALFLSELNGTETERLLRAELDSARRFGLTTVPHLIVAGRHVPRWRLEGLEVPEAILRRSRRGIGESDEAGSRGQSHDSPARRFGFRVTGRTKGCRAQPSSRKKTSIRTTLIRSKPASSTAVAVRWAPGCGARVVRSSVRMPGATLDSDVLRPAARHREGACGAGRVDQGHDRVLHARTEVDVDQVDGQELGRKDEVEDQRAAVLIVRSRVEESRNRLSREPLQDQSVARADEEVLVIATEVRTELAGIEDRRTEVGPRAADRDEGAELGRRGDVLTVDERRAEVVFGLEVERHAHRAVNGRHHQGDVVHEEVRGSQVAGDLGHERDVVQAAVGVCTDVDRERQITQVRSGALGHDELHVPVDTDEHVVRAVSAGRRNLEEEVQVRGPHGDHDVLVDGAQLVGSDASEPAPEGAGVRAASAARAAGDRITQRRTEVQRELVPSARERAGFETGVDNREEIAEALGAVPLIRAALSCAVVRGQNHAGSVLEATGSLRKAVHPAGARNSVLEHVELDDARRRGGPEVPDRDEVLDPGLRAPGDRGRVPARRSRRAVVVVASHAGPIEAVSAEYADLRVRDETVPRLQVVAVMVVPVPVTVYQTFFHGPLNTPHSSPGTMSSVASVLSNTTEAGSAPTANAPSHSSLGGTIGQGLEQVCVSSQATPPNTIKHSSSVRSRHEPSAKQQRPMGGPGAGQVMLSVISPVPKSLKVPTITVYVVPGVNPTSSMRDNRPSPPSSSQPISTSEPQLPSYTAKTVSETTLRLVSRRAVVSDAWNVYHIVPESPLVQLSESPMPVVASVLSNVVALLQPTSIAPSHSSLGGGPGHGQVTDTVISPREKSLNEAAWIVVGLAYGQSCHAELRQRSVAFVIAASKLHQRTA